MSAKKTTSDSVKHSVNVHECIGSMQPRLWQSVSKWIHFFAPDLLKSAEGVTLVSNQPVTDHDNLVSDSAKTLKPRATEP